jgi:hypothetical protein
VSVNTCWQQQYLLAFGWHSRCCFQTVQKKALFCRHVILKGQLTHNSSASPRGYTLLRDLDRIHDDAALIRADRGHRSDMTGSKSESEAIVERPPRRRWQGKSGGEKRLDCLVMSNANSQSRSLFACPWHNASATQLLGNNQPLP